MFRSEGIGSAYLTMGLCKISVDKEFIVIFEISDGEIIRDITLLTLHIRHVDFV